MDLFVQQVVKDRAAADEQISDLRTEVDRLHRYIRRQWTAVAAAESAGAQASGRPVAGSALVSAAMQARAVLSQAEEIAERRLAQMDARLLDAERQATARLEAVDRQIQAKLVDADRQVSRLIGAGEDAAAQRLTRVDLIAERVLIQAWTRYEDIVMRAHQRADQASASDGPADPPLTLVPAIGKRRAAQSHLVLRLG